MWMRCWHTVSHQLWLLFPRHVARWNAPPPFKFQVRGYASFPAALNENLYQQNQVVLPRTVRTIILQNCTTTWLCQFNSLPMCKKPGWHKRTWNVYISVLSLICLITFQSIFFTRKSFWILWMYLKQSWRFSGTQVHWDYKTNSGLSLGEIMLEYLVGTQATSRNSWKRPQGSSTLRFVSNTTISS